MRRIAGILALVVVCSALLAAADSAQTLYKKGVEAEARQDYEAAYTFYKKAYDLKPTDLKYRVPYERTRFLAAAYKVHRAQKLRDQGELQEALALFQEAAAMDPSNDLAAQEARRTQQMIQKQAGPGAAAAPAPKAEEDFLRQRLQEARPPVVLGALPDQPISALEMTNDSKTIYETIGKLAGINVLFDPEYTPRQQLPVKLKGVTLQEALDIVALQSRTFWRAVTPNTIFVAQDTQTKRRELEQNVIKTFYLGNVSAATDLQDIVNAIRTVLEVQRIQQIPSQNAIVIKGTPDQLALAQKMVDDIDKSKPEVIVDIIVAQVRRDKVRNLGITPPQNAIVTLTNGISTTTTDNNGNKTSNAPNLTIKSLEHLNETSFAVTIDPLTATALFTDSNSKILQSPRIRATDGEKATLKIADKIPVATGSFGTPVGVGAAGAGLGVNTQFTYLDVGVIMEITPKVHPDGQVTLKTSLEISNQNGFSIIGGIKQPIISQRKADETIRLNDGEINLLGGILEQSDSRSASGTPFLGAIPFLKYIFATQNKEIITNEIIFLLIPHIVRGQELSDLNRRPVDVGTGSAIDLRIAGKTTPRPEGPSQSALPGAAQPAAFSPAAGASVPAAPAVPPRPTPSAQPAPSEGGPSPSPVAPIASTTTAPASAAAPTSGPMALRLDPGNVTPAQGSTFALSVILAQGQDITTVSAGIAYDPKVMQFLSATPGAFLAKDGQPVTPVYRDDPASGRLQISATRPPGAAGVSGDGAVFTLMFLAKGKGAGAISIATPGARNSQNQQVAVQGSQASVTVP
jgi:general secretion pathway protein D